MAAEPSRELETVLEGGNFFEGLRWHDGHWWASDPYSFRVLKISTDGAAEQFAHIPGEPCGLGFMPDGSVLVVSTRERRLIRVAPDGTQSVHADLKDRTAKLANDMTTDAAGRAYVSHPGFDMFGGGAPQPSTLIVVEPDGASRVGAEGILFPNGLEITPDGRTLIVAETFGAQLKAFDVEDGALTNERVWADLAPTPPWDSFEGIMTTGFAADGLTIDSENHVWVADAFNGRAARVAPDGTAVEEIRSPIGGIYDVALGGEDGHTLLIATAPSHSDVECRETTNSVLLQTRVDVPVAR